MNILQDILGLITKGKVKPPTGKDYMVVASYTDAQEILKPQPKMQANLINLAALKNYILSSIAPPTPPSYKVFTALLTQSGGDNPENISGTPLTIGETYQIIDNMGSVGFDFTNVGAPNNDFGTWFIATGTTPNSWGTPGFEPQLFHNTGAPVAIVLENTIGNIWFEYTDIGIYSCNSDALFTERKTTISIDAFGQNGNLPDALISNTTDNGDNKFVIKTDKLGLTDDLLLKNRLEIKVYN